MVKNGSVQVRVFVDVCLCVTFVRVSVLSQLVVVCLSVKLGYSVFGGWAVGYLLDLITNSA